MSTKKGTYIRLPGLLWCNTILAYLIYQCCAGDLVSTSVALPDEWGGRAEGSEGVQWECLALAPTVPRASPDCRILHIQSNQTYSWHDCGVICYVEGGMVSAFFFFSSCS